MVALEERQAWVVDRDEWADVIENLTTEHGELTSDDLLSLIPEAQDNPELLDALLHDLANFGVTAAGLEETDRNEIDKSADAAAHLESIRPDDLLSVYLAEMSQEPLLTHAEEIELARQIEMGRLAQQTIQKTDYNSDEFARLQAQVEVGQAARERLGRANTRLVVSIAKRYRGFGIPFTDLIQDGNVGLMRAVDRYDHRTGNRFSTYATWWIRQAVTRSLANQGRVIRIPVHMGGRMREMAQVAQRLEMEQGQKPTPEEIAAAMNESPTKIHQMMQWASQPLSLEQPVGEEGDVELSDFVEDEASLQPDELTDFELLSATLEELLNNLSAREARILRLRYGLQDGRTRTLHEVAEKFGLSRERIRQIEREAMAKIRLVAPDYRLKHFLAAN
jgi:RNA polymerase primary sigma factor